MPPVTTIHEYAAHAAECRALARYGTSHYRAAMLQIALAWDELATGKAQMQEINNRLAGASADAAKMEGRAMDP